MYQGKLDEAARSSLHRFVKHELQALIERAGKVGFEPDETFMMVKHVVDANVRDDVKAADAEAAREEAREEVEDALRH
jgi:hypothetical protein